MKKSPSAAKVVAKKVGRRVPLVESAAPRRKSRLKSAGQVVRLVRRAAKSFNEALDTDAGLIILAEEGIYTKSGQLTKHYR